MTIEIEGHTPSKKNSRQHFLAGGRRVVAPSKQYQEWHELASWQIASQRPHRPLELADVTLTFYAKDRRPNDLSNKAESVMDLLVDAGFLKDDNWNVVPNLTLRYGGIDRERPRAVVEITPAML